MYFPDEYFLVPSIYYNQFLQNINVTFLYVRVHVAFTGKHFTGETIADIRFGVCSFLCNGTV